MLHPDSCFGKISPQSNQKNPRGKIYIQTKKDFSPY
jgi:hypothetical protein